MNRFQDDPALVQLRAGLSAEAALMQGGLFADPDTGRTCFSGYAYQTLYDWDQYFEAILQVYMGWPSVYIKNGVLIFLEHQRADGSIARSVPSNAFHDPEHVKPFLAQIACLVQRVYGELDWIGAEPNFSRLQAYLDYWLSAMDADGDGLSEWLSAPHTGMDNQHERAGWWLDRCSAGVDLNCYLVRECRAFARLARLLGRTALAETYAGQAAALAERIRARLWDETDGFFYDRNARAGEPLFSRHAGWAAALNASPGERIRVKSVAGFMPLWAGVATPEQARRMVFEHLTNPAEFWRPHPLPALARSERWYSQDWLPADLGCNWRAKTWLSTNYMVYHGLRAYGYAQVASLLAQASWRLVRGAGNREYYDAESGAGCGLDPFWGWSLLAHFLPYEETTADLVIGIDDIGDDIDDR
jgi:putative isomerase